jgi:hypothetical protein
VHAHKDNLRGISEAIVNGAEVSIGTGGDFRIMPQIIDEKSIPPQPIPQPFEFRVPDISLYVKPPLSTTVLRSAVASEESVRLTFLHSDLENAESTALLGSVSNDPSQGKKRGRGAAAMNASMARSATVKWEDLALFGRKGEEGVLRPSSPVAFFQNNASGGVGDGACANPYGNSGVLQVSSPKRRKQNERRKPRLHEVAAVKQKEMSDTLLLTDNNVQTLLSSFFESQPKHKHKQESDEEEGRYNNFCPSSP